MKRSRMALANAEKVSLHCTSELNDKRWRISATLRCILLHILFVQDFLQEHVVIGRPSSRKYVNPVSAFVRNSDSPSLSQSVCQFSRAQLSRAEQSRAEQAARWIV